MALPKKRHTKSQRNQRRSHLALKSVTFLRCAKCGKALRSHMLCENCGTYRGREVIDVLAKLDKKERKKHAAAEEARQEEQKAAQALNPEELSKK